MSFFDDDLKNKKRLHQNNIRNQTLMNRGIL